MKTSVIVKTQLEALHCWPDVPKDHPSAYLANPHRHMFHIALWFKVEHSNRDIEFIKMKSNVDGFLTMAFHQHPMYGILDLKNNSCEHLAEFLLTTFKNFGCFKVSVLEDGEMGAVVELES